MKKYNINILPLVMTILSLLYFLYVAASQDTILQADAVGGDPGGKVLPYIMSVFMFFGFLYLTIKEKADRKPMDVDTKMLFFTTLVLSILYVLLLRPVGFVILSSLVLYTLLYLYTSLGEKRDWRSAIIGGASTLAGTCAVYYLFRFVTKLLLHLGRKNIIPSFFGSSTVCACIALAIVVGFTFLFALTLCRMFEKKGWGKVTKAGVVTFATVLFLYIVFKQFFMVALAPGILNY